MTSTFLLSTAAQVADQAPELTTGILVVFSLVLLALVLFITEVVRMDVAAILLMVLVIVLSPWTGVDADAGFSGFSSQATIAVLAMFILSEGIRRTGVLQLLGRFISKVTGGNPRRQLAALVGLSGGTAGFINNTPVVAMMIPMTVNIANRSNVSPSRYLIPVSFAAMMGGMLTVIGTSTSLLASDVSARLLDHPFSMFEFTRLGLMVLGAGLLYLMTVGWWLTPARIKPREDPIDTFEMGNYLTELHVRPGSSLAGLSVERAREVLEMDLEILRIRREGRAVTTPMGERRIRENDVLIVRTDPGTVRQLLDLPGIGLAGGGPVERKELGVEDDPLLEGKLPPKSGEEPADAEEEADAARADQPARSLLELVVLSETPLVGETLRSLNFSQAYQAWVLAIRRGSGILHSKLNRTKLAGGDTLLVQAGPEAIERLSADRNFIVSRIIKEPEFRRGKTLVAIGIVAGVVAVAATGLLPIAVSALAGVVAMVISGCLRPNELYAAVDWNVIFLLAGLIPLGVALEQSGGAQFLALHLVEHVHDWNPILVVFAFYLFTALITEVISNNASVVLMIPIAVGAAEILGADPFAFVMAITFAASTAMLSPVGYQTNLMVYGPGGYRFTDFFRVGAPLQLILALVTTFGIWVIWGV
ncbi:MAG: SLC13 family permease [Gemmatimonadales bacterium]|nr:MAG: SLC13 family permease [Gemmatimonadales bacterium]